MSRSDNYRLGVMPSRVPTLDTSIAALPPKTVDPHYQTPEHREWSRKVIERAGGRCEDPECKGPHWKGQRLYADHKVELKDGGAPFDLANGMARCASSHTRKTARLRAERTARRY